MIKRPLNARFSDKAQADMAAWFSAKMKPGQSVTKHLMRFRRL